MAAKLKEVLVYNGLFVEIIGKAFANEQRQTVPEEGH